MISSNENLGDRPVRRHINKIAFVAMAFMALVIVLAVWFFAVKKPDAGALPTGSRQQPTQNRQQ